MLMDENTTISFEGFKRENVDIDKIYKVLESLESSPSIDHAATNVYPSGYLETTDEPFCIGILVMKRSIVKKTITALTAVMDGFEAIVVCNETRKLEWYEENKIIYKRVPSIQRIGKKIKKLIT